MKANHIDHVPVTACLNDVQKVPDSCTACSGCSSITRPKCWGCASIIMYPGTLTESRTNRSQKQSAYLSYSISLVTAEFTWAAMTNIFSRSDLIRGIQTPLETHIIRALSEGCSLTDMAKPSGLLPVYTCE